MVWSRRMSTTMGSPEDFKKALKDTFTDPEVLEFFKAAFSLALKDEIDGLKSEIGILRTEMGTLREVVKAKDNTIKNLQDKVKTLETDFDDLEQYSRRNSVRISGIPEKAVDNIEERVMDLFQHKMGVDNSITDVDRMHRVGRRGNKPRAVLVKFASYRARQAVFQAKRYLKPNAQRPIRGAPAWTVADAAGLNVDAAVQNAEDSASGDTTADDETRVRVQIIPEPKETFDNIFISEDLTEYRQFLLYKCRTARRDGHIADSWSHDGQVLIKDNNGHIVRIRDLADIPRRPNVTDEGDGQQGN